MRVVREPDNHIFPDDFLKEDLSGLLFGRTSRTEFVFRVPSRIVIMRRGLWHKNDPVKNQAPMARCSVAGFALPDD